jgi:hypothetical protein
MPSVHLTGAQERSGSESRRSRRSKNLITVLEDWSRSTTEDEILYKYIKLLVIQYLPISLCSAIEFTGEIILSETMLTLLSQLPDLSYLGN